MCPGGLADDGPCLGVVRARTPYDVQRPRTARGAGGAVWVDLTRLGSVRGRDDVEGHGGAHVVVQPHGDFVGAERLDRVADRDGPLVDLLAGGGAERLGDVGDRDGTEQPTALAGADLDLDRRVLERGLEGVGGVLVADRTRGAGLLDRVDGLLGTAGPADRRATRDEVVAAVAVLDLDHVAGSAETGDLLGEDELHRRISSQRPVDVYGSSATSRAFLTAMATSRWCWTQLPVTRRARILPRSEMNLRRRAVSL